MKNITAFGDSIMRGIVLDSRDHDRPRYTILEDSFSTRCSKELSVTINNYARFGNTTNHGLRELMRRSEDVAASDFVILEFGGNDCDHLWSEISADPEKEHHPVISLDDFVRQYTEMIDYVRSRNSKPVLLSLPPIIPNLYFDTITKNMDIVAQNNVLKWLGDSVDSISRWHEMYNLQIFKMAAVNDIPLIDISSAFLQRRNCCELFCRDGIHPNEKGHQLIAQTICNAAKPFLM